MKLFEKDDLRAYELLNVLLEETSHSELTLAFLSKKLNTDRRIIQKYLQRLIEDNKQICSPQKLDLYITDKGIVHLTIPPYFDKNAFKSMYYERSISFKLMIDILMENFVSIEEFADRNFISIPSVYRKLPSLREQLQILQVDLDLKAERKFIGSERQIRLFYFYLLSDVQNYLDIPNFLTVDGQNRYGSFTNLWLTITHFRLTSGNYINQTDELDAVKTFSIDEEVFNALWKDIMEELFDDFSLEKTILSAEKHCLYIILNSAMGLSSSRQGLSDAPAPDGIDSLETNIERLSYTWVKQFIDFFQLKVTVEDFNYLYQVMLHGHSVGFIFRQNVHWIHRMNDYSLVILDSEALEQKIDIFFDIMQNDPNLLAFSPKGINSTLSMSYTFYIHSFLTVLNLPIRLYIFSRLGALAVTYLQERVAKFSMVPVTFVEDETEADILISDTYNPFTNDIPVIHVQPLPPEHELLHIKAVIEKKYYENMLKN